MRSLEARAALLLMSIDRPEDDRVATRGYALRGAEHDRDRSLKCGGGQGFPGPVQAGELHGGGREGRLGGVPGEAHELHCTVQQRLLEVRLRGCTEP